MRVVFFGTPQFALPALEALAASYHKVVGVVSGADKPSGRGREVTRSPVVEKAMELGLPLLQPADLKHPDFLAALARWEAEIFAVVAFRILPEVVFNLPRQGAINLHASLLPAYRGAAPIQWALWKGETATGVTTFRIVREVDTGNILKQRQVEILGTDDAGSLSQRLAGIGADLLVETMTDIENGTSRPLPQDAPQASPAPKITREHCLIDWRRNAIDIHNQVRALAPEPGALISFEGKILKLCRTEAEASGTELSPGELLITGRNMAVGTARGHLHIKELQIPGKKRMETEAFLRGFRVRGRFQIAN